MSRGVEGVEAAEEGMEGVEFCDKSCEHGMCLLGVELMEDGSKV